MSVELFTELHDQNLLGIQCTSILKNKPMVPERMRRLTGKMLKLAEKGESLEPPLTFKERQIRRRLVCLNKRLVEEGLV